MTLRRSCSCISPDMAVSITHIELLEIPSTKLSFQFLKSEQMVNREIHALVAEASAALSVVKPFPLLSHCLFVFVVGGRIDV